MMNKYRVYIQTSRGSYTIAAGDSVNGLAALARSWFLDTSPGRSVYDDMITRVILYEFDPKTGAYKFGEQAAATSRRDVLKKLRAMGGR